MIIKTKVAIGDGSRSRTAYYKHMGTNGKPLLGSKRDAAAFDEATAAKVLEHLKLIDHRFQPGEVVSP